MGEIKSTLDLVLEKTKHLSQSSEEKQAQIQKDIENRVNGILQKYLDGLFSLEQLQRDYDALKAEFNLPENTILALIVPNLTVYIVTVASQVVANSGLRRFRKGQKINRFFCGWHQ